MDLQEEDAEDAHPVPNHINKEIVKQEIKYSGRGVARLCARATPRQRMVSSSNQFPENRGPFYLSDRRGRIGTAMLSVTL